MSIADESARRREALDRLEALLPQIVCTATICGQWAQRSTHSSLSRSERDGSIGATRTLAAYSAEAGHLLECIRSLR